MYKKTIVGDEIHVANVIKMAVDQNIFAFIMSMLLQLPIYMWIVCDYNEIFIAGAVKVVLQLLNYSSCIAAS